MNKLKTIFITLLIMLSAVFTAVQVLAQVSPTGSVSGNPPTVTVATSTSPLMGNSNISANWSNFAGTAVVCVSEPGTSGGADIVFASGGGPSGSVAQAAPWIQAGRTYTFKLFDNTSVTCGGTQVASNTVNGASNMSTGTSTGASFQGGNIFIVGNTSNPGWGDPVNAQIGDIVEFKVDITNMGPDTMATNVQVKADFPTNVSGNTIASTIHVKADNAPEITDTATVNVTNANSAGARHLVYFPGHAVIIAHPGNVTTPVEAVGSGGWVNVGNLSSQNNSYIEVLFKAQITQSTPLASPSPSPVASVAPSPSPSPSPAASIAPSPSPSASPASVAQSCPAGQVMTGINQQGQLICINNSSSSTSSSTSSATGGNSTVTITNPAPPAQAAVAGVKVTQLPKTGLPTFLALGLAGLLPLGIKLRSAYSVKEEMSDNPSYLFEQREFKKAS